MRLSPVIRGFVAAALGGLALSSVAQVIELRARIEAAQENPATSSPAAGTAIMLYDVRANTFDLIVSVSGMTNVATASHLHEGPTGTNGGVVTNLGAEAVYTRSGSTLTATFRNLPHGGDRLKLIQGGAYYNLHSAQFPGGEVRGQLIPTPIRLVAKMDAAQEQAGAPTPVLAGVNNFGAAVLFFDPAANTISVRHSLFLFTNQLSNSHIHEGAPGVAGPVRTNIGNNATLNGYTNTNGHISGSHDLPFVGDPVLLLTGGMYLNYHSTTFAGGQLRGQIAVSTEALATRYGNLSIRGFVGSGEQVLIGGLSITGNEPIRTLITAKGPSLAAFGVTGAVANPRLDLFDSAGRLIATNDDVGAIVAGSELSRIPGVPTNALESALVVVLPPGNYTAQVSAASGTGVALLETYDLRSLGAVGLTVAATETRAPLRATGLALAQTTAGNSAALEFCAAVPLAVAVAQR